MIFFKNKGWAVIEVAPKELRPGIMVSDASVSWMNEKDLAKQIFERAKADKTNFRVALVKIIEQKE